MLRVTWTKIQFTSNKHPLGLEWVKRLWIKITCYADLLFQPLAATQNNLLFLTPSPGALPGPNIMSHSVLTISIICHYPSYSISSTDTSHRYKHCLFYRFILLAVYLHFEIQTRLLARTLITGSNNSLSLVCLNKSCFSTETTRTKYLLLKQPFSSHL